ncbi:MAG: hypothetical protein KAG53_03000 [Endozoicomonadaceae bacterium]|nr:hypothetical protein [Endozoicomonadaceae bacterium]
MDTQMIKFSIKSSCSYTWNKNRFNKKSTTMNVLDCTRTLACGVFRHHKVELSKVAIIYNNNRNTIFGKEYENHINRWNIEVQHHTTSSHDNSRLEDVITSADELEEDIIVNTAFLPDDLIVKTLLNLHTKNICVSRKVSRHWKRLIDNNHLISRIFYSDCHPFEGLPDRQKVIDRYKLSTRQRLKTFSDNGAKLVKKLDMLLTNRFFPEILFFYTAKILNNSEVFFCKEIATITHSDWVINTVFSLDGKYLKIGSMDNTTRIWNLVEGGKWKEEIIPTHEIGAFNTNFISYIEYVKKQCLDGSHVIQISGLVEGGCKITINLESAMSIVRMSPDRKYIATVAYNGFVKIYEICFNGTLKVKATSECQTTVYSAQFSPDGNYFAVGSGRGVLRIFDLVKGEWEEQYTPRYYRSAIVKVYFSPDSKHFVIVLCNNTAQILELVEETVVPTSCTTLVTTAMAQSVRLGGKPHQALEARSKVCELAKDSGATSFIDQGVKRAEIAVERRWKEKVIIEHKCDIDKVSFSPSGNYLVTASKDKTA